jgi:hypothetical protein
MPKVCKPMEVNLIAQSELKLRRMALESLDWRLWCEDDEKTNDHTHYVYWVGPNGEQNAHWWAEGVYRWNPGYHWFPPEFPMEELLKGYDWELRAICIENETSYKLTLRTPWTTAAVSKGNINAAVYSVIILAFNSVPDKYKIKPYKEVQE